MARLLIYVALIALVWWIVRSRTRAGRPPERPGEAASPPQAERMVDCARCGVHLPSSETVADTAGRSYCCAAHRDAGPR
jgi:uncharacterized protein